VNFSHRAYGTVDEGSIGFSLNNLKVPAEGYTYVFMTEDRSLHEEWGRFKFTIKNSGTTLIEITNQSRLEIYVPDTLMGKSDLEQIRLVADAPWTLRVSEDDLLELTFHGAQPLKLGPGEKHDLSLANVFAPMGMPADSAFAFAWYAFGGVEDDSKNFKILSLAIPQGKDEDELGFEWVCRDEYLAPDTIYPTPYAIGQGKSGISNRLLLRVSNARDETLYNEGAYVRVTFFTEDYGSMGLLTAEQLKDVQCRLIQPRGEPWEAVPDTTAMATSWLLRPRNGQNLVFTTGKMVIFEFTHLVTQLGEGSSPILIHWGGIRAHNPGHRMRAVTKIAPTPYVMSYTARSGTRRLESGDTVLFKEEVTLTSDLFAADAYMLEALGPEKFPWPPVTKIVRPDRAVTDYKLTPAIQLPGRVKTGNVSPFSLKVAPPTAKLEALVEPDGMAKLRWDCTNGDCFLSGPGLARMAVEAKGDRRVEGVGTYEIECVGISTVKASTFARRPHPQCTIDTYGHWTTSYTQSCDVTIQLLRGGTETSHALSGSAGGFGLDTVLGITLVARGYGTITANANPQSLFSMDGNIPLPTISFSEEPLSSGDHRIRWKCSYDQRGQMGLFRLTFLLKCEGAMPWSEFRDEGDVTKSYVQAARTYKLWADLSRGSTTASYELEVTPHL
jgi:hypothetical protein